jgi:hypothetical protein
MIGLDVKSSESCSGTGAGVVDEVSGAGVDVGGVTAVRAECWAAAACNVLLIRVHARTGEMLTSSGIQRNIVFHPSQTLSPER